MALQTTGGAGRVLPGVGNGNAQRFFEHRAGDDPVAEHLGAARRQVHHRRLDPEFAGAALQNHVELPLGLHAQILRDVPGRRRADAPERVGGGGGEALLGRAREALQKRMRDGVRGAAERHRVLTARHPEPAAGLLLQHDRERPRPVEARERAGGFGHAFRPEVDRVGVGDVHDEGMVRGTALRLVRGEHGVGVVGVGGEPVDRFGRDGDETAFFQNAGGAFHGVEVDVEVGRFGHAVRYPEKTRPTSRIGRRPFALSRKSIRSAREDQARGPLRGRAPSQVHPWARRR